MRSPIIRIALVVQVLLPVVAVVGANLGEARPASAEVAEPRGIDADFNGDGYGDLAIGVPYEDVEAIDSAGAVNVIYGSAGGLSATAVPDQFWTQASFGVEEIAEAGDQFGAALACGDFNNDGYADLAVGVPYESVGDVNAAGGVNVIYGSAGGLSATAIPDQFWSQDSPNINDVADPSDLFGYALAAGNFGGGGQDDLAIGVPDEDVGAALFAGLVNVIYGARDGLSATVTPDQVWSQNRPDVEEVSESFELLGGSLAAGNFGGTVHADLAIGVAGETIGSVQGGGINVIYGSADGLSATATPDQFWSQDSPDVEGVAEEADLFGFALAAGNFGGTAKDDLAIGVPDEDIGSIFDAGGINVLYGSVNGLSATITPDQFWSQDTASVEDASEDSDVMGGALAAGDFNGDSYADVAIGAQYEEINSSQLAGAVNVIYGSSSGLSATATPDQFWHQDVAEVAGVAEPEDYLGWSLAAADFGSSSHDDLAMGVPGEDIGTISEAGGVNVLYGSTTGLSATVTPDQFWSQDSPFVEGFSDEDDEMGNALAAVN